VLDWLAAVQPDVLCLQETKTEDKGFPFAELEAAGYRALHNGQKTYNGVAILARAEPGDIQRDIPGFDDPQKRIIAATVNGVRLVCAYMPNGSEVGSEKYEYKLKWLAALTDWLRDELMRHPRLALLGDYNIAPEDRDVHDPEAWRGKILCSEPERAAFQGFLDLGLTDAFRRFEQPEKSYSWWDYRMMAFRRNIGLRIDHILLSTALAEHCHACTIDKAPRKLERPSDHAPVVAEIAELAR
jgi:exodeoxyribonuclease-3